MVDAAILGNSNKMLMNTNRVHLNRGAYSIQNLIAMRSLTIHDINIMLTVRNRSKGLG